MIYVNNSILKQIVQKRSSVKLACVGKYMIDTCFLLTRLREKKSIFYQGTSCRVDRGLVNILLLNRKHFSSFFPPLSAWRQNDCVTTRNISWKVVCILSRCNWQLLTAFCASGGSITYGCELPLCKICNVKLKLPSRSYSTYNR